VRLSVKLHWRYLALAFALTWIVWIPGILLHVDVTVLTFGSAGPAMAAMWLARRGKKTVQAWLPSQLVCFGLVWLIAWLTLELSPPGRGGYVWPIRWNPIMMLLATLPAWIFSRAFSADGGIRALLHSIVVPRGWRWPVIAFLAIPAYLLIPAGLARFIGMPLVFPPHHESVAMAVAIGGLSFARNFLFTAAFEEPGWRGTLLSQLQRNHSPLVASLLVWFPWMLWHAPLDLSGGMAHTFAGWLQIRVIFLIPMSILLTWVYNRSGRTLLCPVLFHAALNTFPFVLPYARPMLGLLFVWVACIVVKDRMWRAPAAGGQWEHNWSLATDH